MVTACNTGSAFYYLQLLHYVYVYIYIYIYIYRSVINTYLSAVVHRANYNGDTERFQLTASKTLSLVRLFVVRLQISQVRRSGLTNCSTHTQQSIHVRRIYEHTHLWGTDANILFGIYYQSLCCLPTRKLNTKLRNFYRYFVWQSVSVAGWSKAQVCGRSSVGNAGSNPFGGMDVSLLCVVCLQVEVSATGRSVVLWSPTARARACVCACVRPGATITPHIDND